MYQTRIKLGIDSGGGSLKIGLSVEQQSEEEDEQAFEENTKENKNLSSANRILLLAIGSHNFMLNINATFKASLHQGVA